MPDKYFTDGDKAMASQVGDGGGKPITQDTGGAGESTTPGDGATRTAQQLAEELARTQSERDAAVSAMNKEGRRARRRVKARRAAVGSLVVLFALLLPITVVATWAHNVVLNTNGWTRTVEPIASKPAVTDAISREVTNEVFAALNPQQLVAGALPPNAAFLAGPVTNGAKGYIQDGVTKALQSQQFQTLWIQANQFAHTQLVSVLRGKSNAVTTTNGQVVLNLVPLLNAALQNVQEFVSGVVGKPVTLPAISGNELPSAACQRIATALGRPLPSTCGQIPLFPANKLTGAQDAVRAFDRIVVLLLILTPVLAALALWLSRRRRRTLLQLTVGGLLGLVVARRATMWLQNTLVNTGKPENKAARQAILNQALHTFFAVSLGIVIGLFVILAAALITGPYPWARAFRTRVGRIARYGADLARAATDRATDDVAVGWVRSHVDMLRIGGAVVAALLLLLIPVSFIGFLIIAGLLVVYELWLARLGKRPPPSTAPQAPSAAAGH